MPSKEYKEYIKSDEWAKIRMELFLSRGKKCEKCGKGGNLQVHHKTYKNLFKEEPEDLEILCRSCHKAEHFVFKKGKAKRKLSVKQILIQRVAWKKKRKKKKRHV